MFWSLLLILWNFIFFFFPTESCSVLFLISGNFLLELWNLSKWFVIIYDAQIHIRGIVQWGTLTLHIRMPPITQIINDLQRALQIILEASVINISLLTYLWLKRLLLLTRLVSCLKVRIVSQIMSNSWSPLTSSIF